MKRIITAAAGVVLAAGLTTRTASAGAQTAAFLLDTRADILAEVLPVGSADYSLEADDPTLTVKFLSPVVGSYVLPDDMGPLAFDLNGQTVSGTNGVNGTTTTAGGDGGPVFQVGGEITIKINGMPGSGSISGGNGGNGNRPGKGAYAFVDAKGDEVAVSDPCELVKKGADGKLLPPSDWQPVGENAYLYTRDGVCYIVGSGSVTNLPAGFDRNSITNAVVEDGIDEIGARFFKKCRKLNAVTLGADVESVGTNAFYLCVALERIKVENAEAVESLKGAVVYQTAIDKDGKPYPIPYIEAPGYKNELYGTDSLEYPDWVLLDSGKPMEASGYHFFKFVLRKIEDIR